MRMIVAADLSWGIGLDHQLLMRIPEDMKYFKETTIGKVVVMGRTTFQALPDSVPLTGRINIVMTQDRRVKVPGAITCHSLPELFVVLSMCRDSDIFIIGGQSVYRQLLDYCEVAYVTRIMTDLKADVYFPDLDQMEHWELCERSEMKVYGDTQFYFSKYQNNAVLMP